ncbi:MAG: hypothetical protein ACFCUU_10985 [Cyclobacteriaceae bacterium]
MRGINTESGDYMPLMQADRWFNSMNLKLPNAGKLNRIYLKLTYNYVLEQTRLGLKEQDVLSGGMKESFGLLGFGAGTTLLLGKQEFNLDITATNILNKAYVDHLSFLRPFDFFNLRRNISVNLNIPIIF